VKNQSFFFPPDGYKVIVSHFCGFFVRFLRCTLKNCHHQPSLKFTVHSDRQPGSVIQLGKTVDPASRQYITHSCPPTHRVALSDVRVCCLCVCAYLFSRLSPNCWRERKLWPAGHLKTTLHNNYIPSLHTSRSHITPKFTTIFRGQTLLLYITYIIGIYIYNSVVAARYYWESNRIMHINRPAQYLRVPIHPICTYIRRQRDI